jgi:dTDP-4-dehydrorhamnose reductase
LILKILLLGKNGQVGWELQRSLAPLGELVALDRNSKNYWGDISHLEKLADAIRAIQPDVIVNAAAYTAVDKAESDYTLSFALNALAPETLAQEAQRLGAWLIHYSTDYVFGGYGDTPFYEEDTPCPLNEYGQSKLVGEHRIEKMCTRHLIFRTSWVYGARGNNFAKTMLRLGQEKEQLKVINDQVGAPTGAELIADVTAHAIHHVTRLGKEADALAGIYHLTASGETTWFDYAKHVLAHAQQAKSTIKIKATEVLPIATHDYPTPARRPLNSRLNTFKLQTTFRLKLPPWQVGVERMIDEILVTS